MDLAASIDDAAPVTARGHPEWRVKESVQRPDFLRVAPLHSNWESPGQGKVLGRASGSPVTCVKAKAAVRDRKRGKPWPPRDAGK